MVQRGGRDNTAGDRGGSVIVQRGGRDNIAEGRGGSETTNGEM